MTTTASQPYWQSITMGALLLLWVGLSLLLAVSRGDPETSLRTAFAGYSRPDAFHHLNRAAVSFWAVHTCLVLIALAATRGRRSDVLVVLMIGPVIATVIAALGQHWSDLDWVVFVGVCLTGWLAGTLVGLGYWGLRVR